MGGVVKSVGSYLGFGSAPGAGQAQSNQAFDAYAAQRSTYEPKFQNALAMIEGRATGQDQKSQQFLDAYLGQQFNKAAQQQQSLAASNTLRNQAAAQREAAKNIAGLQAEQAAQGAMMKYQDMTGAQQQLMEGLSGRIRSFEGAQEAARGTGAETGAEANRERQRGFDRMASIAQGAGKMMAGSDKNNKKNIKDGSKEIESFLDALSSYQYDYKEGKGPKGKKVSVMAQDLEKTPVGKQMVKESEDGKMVDYGQGFAAMLASMQNLHERIKKVEGKK